MFGEVTMKGRKGLPGLSLLKRGKRVRRRPGAMVTSYFAEGVLTGMTGTSSSYRKEFQVPTARGAATSWRVYLVSQVMISVGPPVGRNRDAPDQREDYDRLSRQDKVYTPRSGPVASRYGTV